MIETVISPVAISRIEPLSGAGGAGVTRFSVVVDSMAFFSLFVLQYVPENICN